MRTFPRGYRQVFSLFKSSWQCNETSCCFFFISNPQWSCGSKERHQFWLVSSLAIGSFKSPAQNAEKCVFIFCACEQSCHGLADPHNKSSYWPRNVGGSLSVLKPRWSDCLQKHTNVFFLPALLPPHHHAEEEVRPLQEKF